MSEYCEVCEQEMGIGVYCEQLEKRIAELEAEKNKLKKLYDNSQIALEKAYHTGGDLKEENKIYKDEADGLREIIKEADTEIEKLEAENKRLRDIQFTSEPPYYKLYQDLQARYDELREAAKAIFPIVAGRVEAEALDNLKAKVESS